jgi:hypothetical protein
VGFEYKSEFITEGRQFNDRMLMNLLPPYITATSEIDSGRMIKSLIAVGYYETVS